MLHRQSLLAHLAHRKRQVDQGGGDAPQGKQRDGVGRDSRHRLSSREVVLRDRHERLLRAGPWPKHLLEGVGAFPEGAREGVYADCVGSRRAWAHRPRLQEALPRDCGGACDSGVPALQGQRSGVPRRDEAAGRGAHLLAWRHDHGGGHAGRLDVPHHLRGGPCVSDALHGAIADMAELRAGERRRSVDPGVTVVTVGRRRFEAPAEFHVVERESHKRHGR
mmetsp:Transcript_2408/g.6917  ORF Transcript_2408/g.6917 Transcript_2408/m.6917 type:complete len:221 (+) Transcript_2408:443-1105(+)